MDTIVEKNISSNTVGVMLTDGEKILIIHNSKMKNDDWDIPKGRVDLGESFKKALKRELKEETGLKYKELSLIGEFELGRFLFKNHTLSITILLVDPLPPLSTLKCKHFIKIKNKIYPEIDGYKYISVKKMNKFLHSDLYDVVSKFDDLFHYWNIK
jgi:ADP-ribose pyrophosphatase YjhB (NUDIX family)